MKINSFSRPITQDYSNNPANLQISEKMNAQARGLDQGVENSQDAKNMINTAEGALQNVGESLNRMRELTVQASNGILTDDDRSIIQNEIETLKTDISDSLRNTEFNQISLFEGTDAVIQTGANAGQSRNIEIRNTTLENLGIANLDVTEDADLESIDNAIESISEARSNLGAQDNALSNTINANSVARENTLSSQSQLDEDFAEKVSELKKNQIMQQYSMQMQKMDMNNQTGVLDSIF
ncbi:MAG TPA: flagellin [Clostridia bacterium]|nr:flagellin [Clostridia bacterium]